MAQITINELSIRFRGPTLLDEITCQIEVGERIGLLGRNGSGKTTLMRLLTGDMEPDAGEILFAPATRVALLPQNVPQDLGGRVADVVAESLQPLLRSGELEPWKAEQQVKRVLSCTGLEGEDRFELLSSGMKRRALLARTLAPDPNVLLLDEPTNHLDIATITWLEDFLLRWETTLIFVTHDRMFLRRLASRILELDRGRLFDWSCDYDAFLRRKEATLAAEEKQNAEFDRKLAQEEAWIRQGIKARRTRNEGRVRALEQMRRQHRERRKGPGRVALRIEEGQRSGNLVAAVDEISFAHPHRPIVRDFSTVIMRGDKVGIVGPNGAGKTTLLRLLLGQLAPDAGRARLGTNLQIAYFDQLREQLDDETTVQQNVGDGYDTVRVAGESRHVLGYLQDFLFTPERARTQVKFLSGGERNRVLLARLFAKPANVIVLDEPTNDLDAETLELLEERLIEFTGTVLVVSHDRAFLNNLVTSLIVFEEGTVREYEGGYDDWLRARQAIESQRNEQAPQASARSKPRPEPPTTSGKRRLTYRQQQELAALPARIEQLEAELAELHAAMAQPEYYRRPGEEMARQQARLKSLEHELAEAYQRWETLEELG